jgi:signal peptidase I
MRANLRADQSGCYRDPVGRETRSGHTVRRARAWLAVVVVATVAAACGTTRTVTVATSPNLRLLLRYTIPSGAMEPTLRPGNVIYVVTTSTPKVGDIVVFHPPAGALTQICGNRKEKSGQACDRPTPGESSPLYVKRVVAGPGDRLLIKDGRVYLNGSRRPENASYASFDGCTPLNPDCNYPTPITIPPGYYFTMGDNVDFSDDSRFWGPVPSTWIEGRAEVVCRVRESGCRDLP